MTTYYIIHPLDAQSFDRARVVAEARAWVGTPFHHAAALRGAGVDCARFLMAVYIGLGIVAPFDPGYYAPDWFLHQETDLFVGWVKEMCAPIERPGLGDVMLFRYGRFASHGAIYIGDDRVIHAFRGRGVIEEECGTGSPLAARYASSWTPRAWVQRPFTLRLQQP